MTRKLLQKINWFRELCCKNFGQDGKHLQKYESECQTAVRRGKLCITCVFNSVFGNHDSHVSTSAKTLSQRMSIRKRKPVAPVLPCRSVFVKENLKVAKIVGKTEKNDQGISLLNNFIKETRTNKNKETIERFRENRLSFRSLGTTPNSGKTLLK